MRSPIRHRLFLAQLLLAPLVVAPAADAGMLYKCSTPKGAVTIQSDPCPTGSTEVWKRDSAPAPQPTIQQVIGNPPARAPKGTVAPAVSTPPPARMPSRPPGPMPSMAATPPPPTPPPAAFVPPPSTPSTIPLQWHDEPETPAGQAPPTNNACDSAKAFANSVNDKVWLGLTQDQEQRLYGWVMDQCEQH